MSEEIDIIEQFCNAGDTHGMIRYIDHPDTRLTPHQLVHITLLLLLKLNYKAALLLGQLMMSRQISNPILFLTQAIAGIMFNSPGDEAIGKDLLNKSLVIIPPNMQSTVYAGVLVPVFSKVLASLYERQDYEKASRVLCLLQDWTPVKAQPGGTPMVDHALLQHVNHIIRLLNNAQYPACLENCHRILSVFPDHAHTMNIMGKVYHRQGNIPEALKSFQAAAILMGDKDYAALKSYAEIHVDNGELHKAQPFMQSVAKDNRLVLPYLEMDIAYSCNLHCTACHHYSNYTMKGHVPIEKGGEWLRQWATRLNPMAFRIVGGEPTLNPQLCDYIRLVAELWPVTKRALVSNGYFFERHPDLMTTLASTGTALHVSVHDFEVDKSGKVNVPLIRENCSKHGVFLIVYNGNRESFLRTYQGEGKNMRPYQDGNPAASWKCCCSKCPTIHHGLLWRCPPIAFLDLADERFKLSEVPEWQPYLRHRGLPVEASAQQIADYLSGVLPICAMCPSTPQPV